MHERPRSPGTLLLGSILLLATACSSDSDTVGSQTSAASPSTVPADATTTSVGATTATTTVGSSSTSTVLQSTTTVQATSLEPAGTVAGVVIDVEGTLGAVAGFTLRLSDGTDATFVPVEGLLFDGSAPIDHVRDHMVSGAPVRVEYNTLADGTLSALAVGDA